MAGGPSHIDTFDPKPDAPANIRGEFKPIDTAVPGIQIAAGWEKTEQAMKDITLVRSMNNKEGNHQRATYKLNNGYDK